MGALVGLNVGMSVVDPLPPLPLFAVGGGLLSFFLVGLGVTAILVGTCVGEDVGDVVVP